MNRQQLDMSVGELKAYERVAEMLQHGVNANQIRLFLGREIRRLQDFHFTEVEKQFLEMKETFQ